MSQLYIKLCLINIFCPCIDMGRHIIVNTQITLVFIVSVSLFLQGWSRYYYLNILHICMFTKKLEEKIQLIS